MSILQKKIYIISYSVLCISILFAFIISQKNAHKNPISATKEEIICKDEYTSFTVRGGSMSPLIEDGESVVGIVDYYNCPGRNPERGDIVIFEDNITKGPYIKTIGAIPGDLIEITKSGTLLVENEELRNASGSIYRFTAPEQNFLNLYRKDGRLMSSAYFVFGENTVSSRDSRKIGAVSKETFKAKVVKIYKR